MKFEKLVTNIPRHWVTNIDLTDYLLSGSIELFAVFDDLKIMNSSHWWPFALFELLNQRAINIWNSNFILPGWCCINDADFSEWIIAEMQIEDSIEMNKDLLDTLTQSIQRAAEVFLIDNKFSKIEFFRERRKKLMNMTVNRVKDGRKYLNLQLNLFSISWQKQIGDSQNMKSIKDL